VQPFDLSSITGPHSGQPVITEGPAPEKAAAALILVHGRGAGAQDIFGLGRQITHALSRRDILLLAPHANRATWYPHRFTEPEELNQPWLDSARAALRYLIEYVIRDGIPANRVFMAGFSQGGCLVADVAARNPRRYGGLFILSGGLIGPPETTFEFSGSLKKTPVLIGCSDVDPHIPASRVTETAEAMEKLGASVDNRVYPGMGHTVNEDELEAIVTIMRRALPSDP
jgi:predicted esterase